MMKHQSFRDRAPTWRQLAAGLALAVMAMAASAIQAQAAPCRDDSWQPTFVHDLTYRDGPWYVMPNGDFIHLRSRGGNWVDHACALIRRYGVRDRRGYTNCRDYTRIQCGCRRGYSEGNSTCRRFLRMHTSPQPIGRY